ncbi:MAG: xanthine dehydrogenase small subunit [Beijerinckiaceae bacterium]|nr:xanthine dehydrogenase small subunit [Beijerinckiaceae bacterium]
MSANIRFLLNGLEEVSVSGPADQTVLQWLRLNRRLTGTKEGCAEGDCGACTIAIAHTREDTRQTVREDVLVWAPANACIMLMGQLHGRLLVTVEGVADGQALHPVQSAMVTQHASQCGYCTPGFVMSLFAGFRSAQTGATDAIHDMIAGNLCRCTGYRPIVAAAREALGPLRDDRFSAMAADIAARLRSIEAQGALSSATPDSKFSAPRTRADLASALTRDPSARILAGGTDLGLDVTKRRQRQPSLISINAVRELQQIEKRDGALVIGAAVTYARALTRLAALDASIGVLLRRLGSAQIRALGTMGGNLANASPIGDTPPILMALGASVIVGSVKGEREIALDAFFTGYRRTALETGEFIDRVIIPLPGADDFVRVDKISRRFDQDISAVCGAIAFQRNGERIASPRIAFGGMAATPARARRAEQALDGAPLTQATFEAAAEALAGDFAPIDDFRASAAYRMRAAQNLFRRWFLIATGALLEAAE